MEIPSGPLAFKSRHAPQPLSELERSILVAAGTGVSGRSLGVPYGPDRPSEHAHYSVRYTGRTAPTAGGFGTPAVLMTDDEGTYFIDTRDLSPDRLSELHDIEDKTDHIISLANSHTIKLSESRLDLPAQPPHMLEPNLWMANKPGSTLFLPIADGAEQVLALMAMVIGNGNIIMDDEAQRTAGNLEPFIHSGLLHVDKRVPLSVFLQMAYEANTSELAFMGHNIVLTMQAMGLGGLYFNGMNRWSILGAFADQGITGFGFRFQHDDRWTLPNPVGLDGHYEALCPPYHADMQSAVRAFVKRKFGSGGTYDPASPGPWKESEAVKSSVTPYSEEFIDCMVEIATYIYNKYGKFPGSFTTIVLTGFVQAVHLDTEFYDEHYGEGTYLESHASHQETWHA